MTFFLPSLNSICHNKCLLDSEAHGVSLKNKLQYYWKLNKGVEINSHYALVKEDTVSIIHPLPTSSDSFFKSKSISYRLNGQKILSKPYL